MTFVTPMRLPSCSASAPILELIYIGQVQDGHIKTLDVMKEVNFEPDARMDGEDLIDQFYVALLVLGEGDELIDALGLAWGLPNGIYDTPERSRIWGIVCMEVMRSVVANSKPRRAIRDATLLMEIVILKPGRFDFCSVDSSRGRG